MNFEPQKFFIGLVDFFSILMPGALIAYLGKDWIAPSLLGKPSFPLQGAEDCIVFLFASYLLGHFTFLLGALLDTPYDWFRKATYLGQIDRLAKGKRLSWPVTQAAARGLFGKNADAALMQAIRIKSRALTALLAESAINAFQWCKARLSRDHPEGLVAVQRFEANSKFFRSLVIVLFALPPILVFQAAFQEHKRGLAAPPILVFQAGNDRLFDPQQSDCVASASNFTLTFSSTVPYMLP